MIRKIWIFSRFFEIYFTVLLLDQLCNQSLTEIKNLTIWLSAKAESEFLKFKSINESDNDILFLYNSLWCSGEIFKVLFLNLYIPIVIIKTNLIEKTQMKIGLNYVTALAIKISNALRCTHLFVN